MSPITALPQEFLDRGVIKPRGAYRQPLASILGALAVTVFVAISCLARPGASPGYQDAPVPISAFPLPA